MAFTPLNWKEIDCLARALSPEIEGLFVDRVIVPERSRFAAGFLKGEWAIRLTGRKRETTLVFSVRPRHPYFYLVEGKGPRAAPAGTHSAFDLSLSKNLKGRKLERLEALPRERFVVAWFAPLTIGQARLGLMLSQVPALPEALLLTEGAPASVLARTRMNQPATFEFPRGENSPEGLVVREELIGSLEGLARTIETSVDAEAFDARALAFGREVRELSKHASDRARQNETALREAERESDWQRFGDLLKVSMGSARAEKDGDRAFWRVTDYETGEMIEIPADAKLEARAQVERYYSLARRKKRRIEEARTRFEDFTRAHQRASALLERVPPQGSKPDWKTLESLEGEIRRITGRTASGPAESPRDKKRGGWLGKSFVSKDGMTILVGRSRDENLELTFRHARGNDIWMHVQGKPGAHVVVPIPGGKSASLETLLDAAALCLHYSNGSGWSTTEIDYTFKKYVKRIKDSTEASYTHNKTLLVKPDDERLKRLLAQSK